MNYISADENKLPNRSKCRGQTYAGASDGALRESSQPRPDSPSSSLPLFLSLRAEKGTTRKSEKGGAQASGGYSDRSHHHYFQKRENILYNIIRLLKRKKIRDLSPSCPLYYLYLLFVHKYRQTWAHIRASLHTGNYLGGPLLSNNIIWVSIKWYFHVSIFQRLPERPVSWRGPRAWRESAKNDAAGRAEGCHAGKPRGGGPRHPPISDK